MVLFSLGNVVTIRFMACLLPLLFVLQMTQAQPSQEFNYDENKVPEFELPDPLTAFDGQKIHGESEWLQKRRPELYAFFEENVYGKVPGEIDKFDFEILETGEALNGKALRKQVRITITRNGRSLDFTILMFLPKRKSNVPMFLGYNFLGNHTVIDDPNIAVTEAWVMNDAEMGISDNRARESSRGARSSRWAVDKIIDGGFGLATIYYGEVDPDQDDLSDGLHALFYEEGQNGPKPDEWGSIAAWSWALSRALDYFQTDSTVDETRVIAFGHSRLGKTSLWAGATDKRFAGVISNNSGCGGAALSKRKFGETVNRINSTFPHWFCDNFDRYNDNEEALPIDQHQLLALIAPRPLYVASAQEDEWADPRGEFLSAHHATPVYDLFGMEGMPSDKMPEVDRPIHNTIAYHIRSGTHDVTDYDWEQYLKWAKKFIE